MKHRGGVVFVFTAAIVFVCLLQYVAGREAYVTLVANDEYAIGARALGASLRATGTKKELVAVVLQGVSAELRSRMKGDGWRLVAMPLFPNPFDMEQYTFTRVSLWSLVDYNRVVFLDADCIVRTNIDEVFGCGDVLCAGMGRHESRKFDFDLGLLVIHPSKPLFQEMLSTAEEIAKRRPESEFNFLNELFLHWCQHGTHFKSAPAPMGPDDIRYQPPLWEPTSTAKGRCFRLDERYNWQWGSDYNATLLGTHHTSSDFNPSVRVVHFAGKNVKPWHWKQYPLHGWMTLWHSYALQVTGGLIPLSWYALHVAMLPIVLLVTYAASLSGFFESRFTRALIATSDRSVWSIFFCLPSVPAKYLSIWAFGAVPLLGVPTALYCWDVILPPILTAFTGWFLFFVWSSMLYWTIYGPYVIYHYMLGCAFASPAAATAVSSPELRHKMDAQLRWIRSTPCYVPQQTSVITACLLHSIGFSLLGNILILLLTSVFAWSSPLVHLVVSCAYGFVVFLLFFAFWGAGLPRHAFLSGFRRVAPQPGQHHLGLALAEAGRLAKSD